VARAPDFPLRHKPRLLKDDEMLQDRREAHAVRLCELRDGRLAARERGQDRAPRRVGQRLKGGVQLSIILYHSVYYYIE